MGAMVPVALWPSCGDRNRRRYRFEISVRHKNGTGKAWASAGWNRGRKNTKGIFNLTIPLLFYCNIAEYCG